MHISSFHGVEDRLLNVVQTPAPSDLVRCISVALRLNPPERVLRVDEVFSLLAVAIGRLAKLRVFKLVERNQNITINILGSHDLSYCHHEVNACLDVPNQNSHGPPILAVCGAALPVDEADRDHLREVLYISGTYLPRKLSYYTDRYQDDWRRLFDATPSLMRLGWALNAGALSFQGQLNARRNEGISSSLFDGASQATLDQVVCFCSQRGALGLDAWSRWLNQRPPLFEHRPDYPPTSTLA